MNRWPYGATGNTGYEYVLRKNSMRNYNSDFAGAIVYTSYLSMSPQYSMDMIVQTECDVYKTKEYDLSITV